MWCQGVRCARAPLVFAPSSGARVPVPSAVLYCAGGLQTKALIRVSLSPQVRGVRGDPKVTRETEATEQEGEQVGLHHVVCVCSCERA